MAVRIVRLGSPRTAGEGLRLGTVRRPPRGVPKAQLAARDWYDLWLPLLAPSAPLVKQAQAAQASDDAKSWAAFAPAYGREMSESAPAQMLDVLAALSHRTHFALGCYCEDEQRCHRSLLRLMLAQRGALFGESAENS
jgi:uncharacterized protein YeaO (DUF488 family)